MKNKLYDWKNMTEDEIRGAFVGQGTPYILYSTGGLIGILLNIPYLPTIAFFLIIWSNMIRHIYYMKWKRDN